MRNLLPGKGRIWTAATILVTALMLFAAACGGDEEPPQCTFGVPQDGRCVNADRCLFQSDCLAGYSCGQGSCQADQECSADADCDAGVCGSNGVCVNPSSCSSNDECVARTYCAGDGTCQADPCAAITCVRGACVPGSGECTNKNSCTKSNELFDCVQGSKCLEGACVTSDNYCDQLTCERGVCDFEQGGCVAADDCAGDDANCLDGQFCNDQNSCGRDLCDLRAVDCGDNGVCQPAAGQCENAETCESNSDCVEEHLCVGGTCTLETMACGDGPGEGGCFGNQTCEYDEASLEATCAVPETCVNSLDCLDGQQCGGDECLPEVSCSEDAFEPNNSQSEATDFGGAALQQTVNADLCSGDSDFYVVDTADLDPFDVRGLLTIRLDYADRDIGLGELELELLEQDANGDFQSVESTTTGQFGSDGGASLQLQLGPTSASVFAIRVAGANGVADAGVSYAINVDVVDDLTVEACSEARVLQDGDILTADAGQATSTLMRHSCSPPRTDGSERPEQLFQFDVTQPSSVSVSVTPDVDSNDAAVSIRSACTASGSEVACSNGTDEGVESITGALLDPGTYYAVVSPTAAGSLGQYDISLSINSAACSLSSSICVDQTTSEYCAGGTGLVSVDCTSGCNPTLGRCFPPDGDRCLTAPTIESAGTQSIVWGELQNDYSIPSGGCLPSSGGSTSSGGFDQAFEVVVPDGKSLEATLNLGSSERGSLYIVTDCSDVSGTCAAGSNEAGAETVNWPNRTGAEQSVFVIADLDAGASVVETDLDIEFLDLICDPNGATQSRCAPSGAAVQNCNDLGTAYVDSQDCSPWPCEASSCAIPDTCSDALNITSAARQGTYSVSDTWSRFATDYDATCGSVTTADSDGWDAVFQVDLQAGEALSVTMNTEDTFPEPSMYIVSTCGSAAAGTCLAGAYVDNSPTLLEYAATTQETVYLVADADTSSSSSQSDMWDLTASIVPSCDPSAYPTTCVSGAVDYCKVSGVTAQYACGSGACTGGECDNRNANFCFDAENLTAAATSTSGTTVTVDYGTLDSDYSQEACGLLLSEVDGPDAYYEFDLVAGDVLEASLDNGSDSDDPALLLVSDCLDASNSCVVGDEDTDVASVLYTATSTETVYLIADNDDPSSTDQHTLSARVSQQQCDPATATATCMGSDVQYCDQYGLFRTYACSGTCTSGLCDTVTADYCFDAEDLTTAANQSGGVTRTISYDNYTNDWSVGGTCGLSEIDIEGPDAYYRIDLAADDVLEASLDNGSDFDDPALMLVTDCVSPNLSCIKGATDFDTATVTYRSPVAQTVYLIADNDDDSSTDDHVLDVEVSPADCDPSTYTATCTNSTDVQYCSSFGRFQTYTCSGSCSSGACVNPDADACFESIDITTAASAVGGTVITGTWGNFDSDHVGDGGPNCGGISTGLSDGHDAVYEVTLQAGETVNATLELINTTSSTWFADPAIAILPVNSCGDYSTCYSGATNGDAPAVTSYTATSAETVVIMADSDDDNTSTQSEEFQLSVNIQ